MPIMQLSDRWKFYKLAEGDTKVQEGKNGGGK